MQFWIEYILLKKVDFSLFFVLNIFLIVAINVNIILNTVIIGHFYEVFDHSSREQNHFHKPSSNYELKVEEYIIGIHSTSQICTYNLLSAPNHYYMIPLFKLHIYMHKEEQTLTIYLH